MTFGDNVRLLVGRWIDIFPQEEASTCLIQERAA